MAIAAAEIVFPLWLLVRSVRTNSAPTNTVIEPDYAGTPVRNNTQTAAQPADRPITSAPMFYARLAGVLYTVITIRKGTAL